MKRFVTALLALLLLLACVGCSASVYTPPTTPQMPEMPLDPTDPTDPNPPVTPADPVLYRNPLTGEPLEQVFNQRVTAFVVNNLQACLPQHGVSQADILYEVETEGGITRMLALFTELEDVPSIGPIRSARSFFNAISLSFDAPIFHCGGSVAGLGGYVDKFQTQLSNWVHIDQRYNGYWFYRDQERQQQGFAYEHTLFTRGSSILDIMRYKRLVKTYENGYDYGLQFAETPVVCGPDATHVTVLFRGGKTTGFRYNAETHLYSAEQYGSAYVDGNNNQQLQFRNVLVLYTSHTKQHDGYYNRSYYDLIGTGDGHMVCDGKIIPIRWHHDAYEDPFTYTTVSGEPIELGIGKTYIAISSTTSPLVYE